MVGRDKIEGEISMAGTGTIPALVALALGLGLGCAADPPASKSNTPSANAGSMAMNLPSTGGSGTGSNKPPMGTAGSTPSGSGTAGMSSGSQSGAGGSSMTTAGSGASGMVNCSALPTPANADDVVSTFEDGTGSVNQTAGRGGGFYMFNDMTAGAMQTPPPGTLPPARMAARCGGMFALCMAGKGFATWGAGMGTDLGMTAGGAATDGGTGMGTKSAYDASAYKGISFWAKANPGSAVAVRVNVKDASTAPEGGVCDAAMSSGAEACNDDWGKNLNLTTEWAPYTLLWTELRQSGWGKAASAFDSKKAYSIQFQVNKGLEFDLCIDDLAFVR
ncbi:MAG TPA: hypothetical protein VK509_03840 [Polyangiales bacterium]|nr:hypothetical protein [Polyangiales bacterium]